MLCPALFYKANLHKLGSKPADHKVRYEMSRTNCTSAHEVHLQHQSGSGVCSEAKFCQIHLYNIALNGFLALQSSGTVEAGS